MMVRVEAKDGLVKIIKEMSERLALTEENLMNTTEVLLKLKKE
jgi:hypothetical protein